MAQKENIMKIQINNLDTDFTIDTYAMFNGESFEEMENSEGNVIASFNHSAIVEALANKSIEIIMNAVRHWGIVKDIKLLGTGSPKYYNYTTDSYGMEVDFNSKKLKEYIKDNDLETNVQAELNTYSEKTPENAYHAMLVVLFVHSFDSPSQYHDLMWEAETEIYSNNCTYLD